MPRAQVDNSARKKMRKGTHSCFECRRRKIRCIFTTDRPESCSECFARGSRCIAQEQVESDVVVDQRKNLRERVAKLEALVDNLLEGNNDQTAAELLSSLKAGQSPPTPASSHDAVPSSSDANGAPVLSLFNNDVLHRNDIPSSSKDSFSKPTSPSIDNSRRPSETCQTSAGGVCRGINTSLTELSAQDDSEFKAKEAPARNALLAILPDANTLKATLEKNGTWWEAWKAKMPGAQPNTDSITQFADHVLQRGTIGQLGILVLSYGISLDTDDMGKFLSTVDRWVTSDDDLAATVDGLECMILQSKVYADIGQPRRAWLVVRRGLTYAQLLGLHRRHAASAVTETVWMSLYRADRFLSLMLGTPYGISDAHVDFTVSESISEDPKLSIWHFFTGLAQIAGKVIDRTQSLSDQQYSGALDLDLELQNMRQRLPQDYWETEAGSLHLPRAELMARLMSQIFYHQIRLYLHLPYMLKSAETRVYELSRVACFDATRDLLSVYRQIRTGQEEPLYECKVVDFIGFTGAVVLLLGLLGPNFGCDTFGTESNKARVEEDWLLIDMCIDVFRRASNEKGGKVAAQSHRVLEQLSHFRHLSPDDIKPCTRSSGKVVIPYFGTISLRYVNTAAAPPNNTTRVVPVFRGEFDRSQVGGEAQMQCGIPEDDQSFDGCLAASAACRASVSASTPDIASTNCSTGPQSAVESPPDPVLQYDGMYLPDANLHQNYGQFPTNGPLQATASVAEAQQAGIPSAFGDPGKVAESAMPAFWTTELDSSNLGVGSMDIDQDWSWFTTDGGGMGGATTFY